MPIIELKLISQQAEQTDFTTAEAQLLAVIAPFLVARDELDLPGELADKLAGRALQIYESGSAGLVLHSLAPAIPQLIGNLGWLPGSAESLLTYINKNQELTMAIGSETEHGISIALWDGKTGAAQTLKVGIQNPSLRQGIIAFAAQDMLRRYLNHEPLLASYETLLRTEELSIP